MSAYGNMDKGLPGLLVGLTETHQIDSRLAKGEIKFGVPAFGTGDGEQVQGKGDSALLGITGRTDYDYPGYRDGDAVNVVRTGKVYAVAGEAISADAEVSVNGATGKIIAKTSAQSAAGSDPILNPGWFARSTAESEGDLIVVDLG